ncbi:MAG TPA: glycosyltransferase family 4 protein [Phycisphaerales bacterium]|nr:glycosyltransferase family 4 protein [Phycisphaerales bacterium]
MIATVQSVLPDTARPTVALIFNVQTPYRLHLTRRLVDEVPGVRFCSLFTHDQADQAWEKQHHAEINPVYFGQGQPVVEIGQRKWFKRDWQKGGEIIAWLKANDVKAVFLGGYQDATRARLIAWCRLHKVPCYMVADSNSRGDLARGAKAVIKKLVVSSVVRAVSGFMVCGRLGAEYFANYGAKREKTFISPYEPDYSLIDQITDEQARTACRRHALRPHLKRIVTCCRLVDVKRVDLVIDAFANISAQRPDFELVVVGSGPNMQALKDRVPEHLRGRVIFTGFIGDQAEISAIYRASHVFALASDYEPWGVVINEAAAAGLAIVSTNVVGAAYELVKEGVNGRTVNKGNLDELTAALLEATDDRNLDRYRAASREVLADWRRTADPVDGMRLALAAAGVPNSGWKGTFATTLEPAPSREAPAESLSDSALGLPSPEAAIQA